MVIGRASHIDEIQALRLGDIARAIGNSQIWTGSARRLNSTGPGIPRECRDEIWVLFKCGEHSYADTAKPNHAHTDLVHVTALWYFLSLRTIQVLIGQYRARLARLEDIDVGDALLDNR